MTLERYLDRKRSLNSFEMVLAMVLWYRKAKRRLRAIKRAGRDDDPVVRELGKQWEAMQKRLREKRERAEAEKGAASGWSAEQLNVLGSVGKFIEGSEARQDVLLRTLSTRLAMDSRREEAERVEAAVVMDLPLKPAQFGGANQKRLVDEINGLRDKLTGDDRELADAWVRIARDSRGGRGECSTRQLEVLVKDIKGLIDSKNR